MAGAVAGIGEREGGGARAWDRSSDCKGRR